MMTLVHEITESKPQIFLKTIGEIIEYRYQTEPDKEAFTFLTQGDREAISWSYRDLNNSIAYTANRFEEQDLAGKRILLIFEPGLSFIAAYLFAISSGAIAVPCHPPTGKRQVKRLAAIIVNCRPSIILCSSYIANSQQFAVLSEMACQMNISLMKLDIPSKPQDIIWQRPELNEDNIAMLQYTSGSTGDPKGVVISQKNLIENCQAIYKWLGAHPQRKGLIWLPPYHDMGLLGGIMQPLYAGFPLVFMSPLHFIQKPFRWLKALSDHHLTTTGAPNFAFQLCVDNITDKELEEASINLSHVREIFCGSEPINPDTMQSFYRRFSKYGLVKTAINPCYGLAEATLFVSGKSYTDTFRLENFDKNLLSSGVAQPTEIDSKAIKIVSSGAVDNKLDLQIVNPDTLQCCAEGDIGEIWITGPNIAMGYWSDGEVSDALFKNTIPGKDKSYYRTGDLGFMFGKELFVTGRIKEVIIIRGRNLYPQDIEYCALKSMPELAVATAAAFSVDNQDTEGLIVMLGIRTRFTPDQITTIKQCVSSAIAAEFNIMPQDVFVGSRNSVLRTTSGKIQRYACKQAYLKNVSNL